MGNRTKDLRLLGRCHVDGYAIPANGVLRNVNNIKHLVRVRLKGNGFVREST